VADSVFDGVFLDHDEESDRIFMVKCNEVDDLEEAYVEMLLMTTIDAMQQLERRCDSDSYKIPATTSHQHL
jgi:hypothetical protein